MPRRTTAREVTAEGTALHAGSTIRMTLAPAASGRGVVFRRSDLGGREIPAYYDRVAETRLGTVIDDASGARVGVIEHLMSAVAGAGIDDLLVMLDGPEPPILAGDALSYLELLDQAGAREQEGEQPIIKILNPVTVEHGGACAALLPAEAYAFDFEITFSSAAIGTQRMEWNFSLEGFRRDIAPARTFGFVHELDALNRAGLGRGASLLNTLAIDGDTIVNAKMLRFPDEFVRHKILDAIGDMALAGAPIVGRFVGRRSGHALNNQLLRALFSNTANYRLVT
jgi:UDP-3-O-[3-hydroxymyristoyl] N-acetylglucosamine deacetylase